jgi:hypothetical protein
MAIAHPEGFPLAVANIYCDLADAIRGEARDGLPVPEAGLRSMAAVHTAVASARDGGAGCPAADVSIAAARRRAGAIAVPYTLCWAPQPR